MLFIALSCLQGRPQGEAYKELLQLNPDGVQLTAGNLPTPKFKEEVSIPYRLHHNFSWNKRKGEVYDNYLKPINIGHNHSIHPPQYKDDIDFNSWINSCNDVLLETMYPGYLLGCGKELEIAMSLKKRLAIDISHIHIMFSQGVISKKQINKLFDYDNIEEIHISHNSGKYDTHSPICDDTPFLHWIKERKSVLWVYESYLHKLSLIDRKKQIDIIINMR